MFTTSQSSDRPLEKPGLTQVEEENSEVLDVDNDPGNEDPGSQFDRDATVPLIAPDDPASADALIDKARA
ncbi:MAG TPA: hypothetical protein VGC62_22565 [Pseudomonas sp.]|uniref:hypothetical protein n=1 Tax=Pseudomonas sp. TaxID=306 RepID=UPI002EDAE06B